MSMVASEEVSQNKEGASNKKKVLAGVLVTLLFLVGCFVWWLWHRKAVGTIRVPEMYQEESAVKKQEKKLYQGKFFTFLYDEGYLEKTHSLPESGPIKETLFLSTSDVEGRKIAVTLADRGTNDLVSDPSFQLRQNSHEEYQSRPFEVAPFQGTLFQKNTQLFEVTAFFTYQGKIMTLSITSPFSLEGLEKELFTVIESLHFSFD